MRMWPEIHAAFDTWRGRLTFAARHGARVIAAPMVPSRMAARIKLQQRIDFIPDCARITVPTLVITGEDELDHIVSPADSRKYLSLIPGAQYEKMGRSGHIGIITRPKEFARIVTSFLQANSESN
jgi:pimeloyl-ACP methyl ester carboxylesterase